MFFFFFFYLECLSLGSTRITVTLSWDTPQLFISIPSKDHKKYISN